MKLDFSPTYAIPVTLQVRGQDGQISPETFTAHFLRMGPDEFTAYRHEIVEQKIPDQAIARRVLQGWSGMEDGEGAEVPFDPPHLDALLAGVHGADVAIVRAWMASVMEELRKNLLPPPSTGSAAANEQPGILTQTTTL